MNTLRGFAKNVVPLTMTGSLIRPLMRPQKRMAHTVVLDNTTFVDKAVGAYICGIPLFTIIGAGISSKNVLKETQECDFSTRLFDTIVFGGISGGSMGLIYGILSPITIPLTILIMV
jgi:hypothetical protein